MQKSESIAALAGALAKAQSEIQGAKKDSENPFFKAKYADLSSVWDACRVALTKNGLSVIQTPSTEITENVTIIRVGTLLAHSSGEWISEELSAIPVKDDPQGIGSCVTYLRRYALSAFTGVAPEDDDGNAASHSNGSPTQRPKSQPSAKQTATEATQIKKALVDTCKLLNEAGDKPTWSAKRLDEFSIMEYGTVADKLELEPLRELLKKLSLKLDAVKAAAKGGDPTEIERKAMVAKVTASIPEVEVQSWLDDHGHKKLEALSLDLLVQLSDDLTIPF